jgi:kumamolisin
MAGAKAIGKADPSERLEVTLLLKRPNAVAFKAKVDAAKAGAKRPDNLSRSEFAQQFSANPADIERVENFATQNDLAVVAADAARRTVILSGTVAQLEKVFGVKLQQFEHAAGSYRGRTGAVHLPAELDGVVEAVLGLDNRPQAAPHFRRRPLTGNVHWRAAATASFAPTELAALYGFPAGNGKDECIAIIELGGGYRPADLTKYFKALKLKAPNVVAVSVDHGRNQPTGDPNGPDGEVMLDIEVAGAVAPRAKIAVYFAPNTDAGFLNAITTAIHDDKNKPSVISISWGSAESQWTEQSMRAFDEAFQAAAAMGVTVCAASGDNGSGDGQDDGKDHVDFPASSPSVLACGGTRLRAADGKIVDEVVWDEGSSGAGGGGVSNFFPVPDYQKGLKARANGRDSALKGRGVPDVAGDADPQTGYNVRVDGENTVIGGTSAVAPLWAGLIALINAAKGNRVGFINPKIYGAAASFNDIETGNNGTFGATPGWDACTGLGTPIGKKIASAL